MRVLLIGIRLLQKNKYAETQLCDFFHKAETGSIQFFFTNHNAAKGFFAFLLGGKFVKDRLTFDDVLLITDRSEVVPADVDVSTELVRGVRLNSPF